jgi:predicted secreted protein|tara:strand:+ start:3208 stop:3600 length:393 start_codon:yes stop_codon:yes gene_type:complete
MATFTGKAGVVQTGSNALAEVRSYSITQTGDTTESTSMGDSAKTFEATLTEFSGSVDVFFDDTDTSGQVSLTIGSSFTLNLAPEGTGSGAYKLSGTAIVTDITRTAAHDGLVEMSIAFQGTGALAIGTYS